MYGGSINKNIDPEIVKRFLSEVEYIDKLCLIGGEISLDLDILENVIDVIISSGVQIRTVRFATNALLRNERFVSLWNKINDYTLEPENGKWRISQDIFHFWDVKTDDSGKEELVINEKRRKRIEENTEWYQKRIGNIQIEKWCNDAIYPIGNALKYEHLIKKEFPSVKYQYRIKYSYIGKHVYDRIENIILFWDGSLAPMDFVYLENDPDCMIGNVQNGVQAEIEKHNLKPKVQTIGKLNFVGSLTNFKWVPMAQRGLLNFEAAREFRKLVPEVRPFAETKLEISFVNQCERFSRSVSGYNALEYYYNKGVVSPLIHFPWRE